MTTTYEDLADNFNRIAAALTYCLHTSLLTYYMVTLTSNQLWYWWVILDTVVLVLMVYCFIVTYLRKRSRVYEGGLINRLLDYHYPGQLPFCVWIWILVAVSASVRLGIIFVSYASAINTSSLLAPSFLQITIGLLAPLFFFTVKAVRLAAPLPRRFLYEEYFLVLFEALNFLDSADILLLLYPVSNISSAVRVAVVIFALVTLFVPLIALGRYTLISYDCYDSKSKNSAIGLDIFHCIASVFFSQVPLFILRIIIWQTYSVNVSGEFNVKEVLFCYVLFVKLAKNFLSHSATSHRSTSLA